MNAFFAWAKSHRNIASKTSSARRSNYLIEEEPYLRRYIEDGRLQIDHNRAELKQQKQVISISATVNLHGGCFDGYILKRNAYSSRNFKRFRNRILHMFYNKHISSATKQATA
ncbi:IS66 family transposase [Ruminococcus bromii]|jgi:hypothetical protein|uniref:IS66 family transposase n=1 Tax=Ruminococcus bromii TaxID=40518 RepID=UPI003FD83A03